MVPDKLENRMSNDVDNPGNALRLPLANELAWTVAARVTQLARDISGPGEYHMWCPDCHRFPVLAVTGLCGHTRCQKCIKKNGACPCGTQPPEKLHLNILIEDLLTKMLIKHNPGPENDCQGLCSTPDSSTPSTSAEDDREPGGGPQRLRGLSRYRHRSPLPSASRQSLSMRNRFMSARELLGSGRYREAVPELAYVAASSDPEAESARLILPRALVALDEDLGAAEVTSELCRLVREESAISRLSDTDLECIICYQLLRRPVTAPCGHTFCRTCMERIVVDDKRCALCSRSLANFSVHMTPDTTFVCAAMAAVDVFPHPMLESDFIPIFVCTFAYPGIPCPLLIINFRVLGMIQRLLDNGFRTLGMVAAQRDRPYATFGTVVEVRDCVRLEDGRSILSTVGVNRFQIVEYDIRDGFHMARIQDFVDTSPSPFTIVKIRILALRISENALIWLSTLTQRQLQNIEFTYGRIPIFNMQGPWWEDSNGPQWLWWLVAVLPLKSEIQLLMLSTEHLLKRMLAILRTLNMLLSGHAALDSE